MLIVLVRHAVTCKTRLFSKQDISVKSVVDYSSLRTIICHKRSQLDTWSNCNNKLIAKDPTDSAFWNPSPSLQSSSISLRIFF